MPSVTITREDVLRGKVLEPGWYPVTVKSVDEEVSSKGDSTNYVVILLVDGPEHVAGTPLKVYFNEKAIGRSIPFINACAGKDLIDEKTVASDKPMTIDLGKTVGKSILAYVANGNYNGRTTNQVEDFRHKQ